MPQVAEKGKTSPVAAFTAATGLGGKFARRIVGETDNCKVKFGSGQTVERQIADPQR